MMLIYVLHAYYVYLDMYMYYTPVLSLLNVIDIYKCDINGAYLHGASTYAPKLTNIKVLNLLIFAIIILL